MGAITGVVTTVNAPNYVGSLFYVTPDDTPFLAMIGGLNGYGIADDTYVTWQTGDNAAAAATAALEGADPTYTGRSRSEVGNVSQIFQYGTDVTYTKMGATGQLGGPGGSATPHLGVQPVQSELEYQMGLLDQRLRRDVNYSFINGTYLRPADPTSTARTTRGILEAITTNAYDNSAVLRAFTKTLVDTAMVDLADGGAPLANPVMVVPPVALPKISDVYSLSLQNTPRDRIVGGAAIRTLITDFGPIGITWDRAMQANTALIVDVAHCMPFGLPTPGKGVAFWEQKPASGSSEKHMLYADLGLKYGPENWHAKIVDINWAL